MAGRRGERQVTQSSLCRQPCIGRICIDSSSRLLKWRKTVGALVEDSMRTSLIAARSAGYVDE